MFLGCWVPGACGYFGSIPQSLRMLFPGSLSAACLPPPLQALGSAPASVCQASCACWPCPAARSSQARPEQLQSRVAGAMSLPAHAGVQGCLSVPGDALSRCPVWQILAASSGDPLPSLCVTAGRVFPGPGRTGSPAAPGHPALCQGTAGLQPWGLGALTLCQHCPKRGLFSSSQVPCAVGLCHPALATAH